jgi:hypothetical protein
MLLSFPALWVFICAVDECFVIADCDRAVRRWLSQRDVNAAAGRPASSPAAFSLVREFGASTVALSTDGAATGIFIATALLQVIAICAFLLGRSP